ncbi:MAG TPA: LacI family DNA-binding transcriptional regulator [Streptosporangiaceae bacterium]|nr:LacI family DNA-binding transcriptional regulator [Streptosporangiaceae bacterium]
MPTDEQPGVDQAAPNGAGRGPGGRSRPRMEDVAAHAGVALKTVSRVVNGEPGVTQRTAERVHAAIDQLGFRRNDSARVLRKGQTASIGLIMEDIGNPFYSALSRAVEDVAREHGHLLFTGSSDEDPVRERELALSFCARRVDGLIVIPTSHDHTYLLPEISAGTAMVFVDRPACLIEADTVLSDNVGGAREAVDHLIRHGHQRVGFIGDSPRVATAVARLRGYREAMAAARLGVDDTWVALSSPTDKAVRLALCQMLTGPAPITALFCGNNRVSVLALRELGASGISLAFVGFDDFELADLLRPGITVVAQDVARLGRVAAELLFRRLAGHCGPAEHINVGTRLVQRGSGELPPTRIVGP